jgi:hypothetical protein
MNSFGEWWRLVFRYYGRHFSCAHCIRNISVPISFGGEQTSGTPAYDEAVERVHKKAVALVLALPNPGQLTRARLVAAADEDTGAESVLDVVRLFQWLLPGLVNVAFMRKQTLPS